MIHQRQPHAMTNRIGFLLERIYCNRRQVSDMAKARVQSTAEQLRDTFCANLQSLMDEAGMERPTDLYKALLRAGYDISPSTITRWFKGDTIPSIDHLVVLATFFKSSVPDLLSD